jgi:hypothetical protein
VRRGIAALAAVVAGAVAVALAVTPSAASWVDREWISAPVTSLRCGDAATVNATAWGRVATGSVGASSLDPVAAIDGIVVANAAPATASSAASAAATTSLGSDAWSSALDLSVLSGLSVGGGLTLPTGASTGVYTQYGRATSGGVSVGASGAVTSASGGVVALESPASATPRVADLRLSGLLDASLPGLGVTTAQLADVALRVGTIGAIASYDSCSPLWSGAAPGSALTRDYLLQDLGVDFTSSTVSGFASGLRASLTSLESSLDALLPPGTTITGSALTSITSALSSALNLSVLGVGISLAQVDSVKVGVDVDLAPVRALVTGTLSDGVVGVDLGTGRVSADLEALFGAAYGTSGLNGLAPNTSVLTAPVLAALSSRVGVLLQGFATGVIQPALTAALQAATVTAVIDAHLRTRAGVVNVVGLELVATITGTAAGFTTGSPAPTVTAVASEASSGVLTPLLGLLGLSLTGLVNGVQAAVVAPLLSTVVPAIGSAVVTPVMTSAATQAAAFSSTLTGTTIPGVLTALAPALTALRTLVAVVANARPDAAGSVGAPVASAAGRYFETALCVRVVNGSAAQVARFDLANASVGPNALR